MKFNLLTASLIAVPALVALKPIADSVAFQPDDGSSASKEYEINVNMSLGDFTAMLDGQDMSEMVPGDFEMSAEILMSVTDLYVSSEDGRPVELIRTFDALSMAWETGDDSGEDDEMADMEGKRVLFKWNADDEAYDKSFHECEGDEDRLNEMTPLMDFQGLLPDGDVEVGDSWTLDSDELGSLLIFGTNPEGIDMADAGEGGEIFAAELMPQIKSMLEEFEVQCTYRGTEELDGMTVGVIAVEVSSEGDIDLVGLIEQIAMDQIPPEVEIDLSVDEAALTITVEGSGELYWNLGAGNFQSYDMSSTLEILADLAVSVDAQGESHDMEASAEILGDITWAARMN